MTVFLITLAAVLATFLGGRLALRLTNRLPRILAYSAGAVIGVAFFDLLPEAVTLAQHSFGVSVILSISGLGFAVYALTSSIASHHNQRGRLGASSLSIHSFMDGMGIGLAFHVSRGVGLVVALAVIAHDFSDGINTVSVILKNGGTQAQAWRWLLLDALAPALGVIATLFFHMAAPQLGLALALFSGFFLYLGASDLLPESREHQAPWTSTVITLLGMATIFMAIHFANF